MNKIADDHAAVERVQHAMEAQTASLARLQEQLQGIIGIVLEQRSKLNDQLKQNPVQVLRIDKVFEPLAT